MLRANTCLNRVAPRVVLTLAASLLPSACVLAQLNSHDWDETEQRLIADMRAGAEQMKPRASLRQEARGPFEQASQLKTVLELEHAAYERSEGELRQALEAAIDHIPPDDFVTDFRFEREVLLHLKQRTLQLANHAEMLISRIDQHRKVSGVYLTSLTSATPTYASLAAQFRQYAGEEQYLDRREDYLVLASVFDQLGERYRTAPTLVRADATAIDELYPYLQSTHVLLKRTYGAVSVIPADSFSSPGTEFSEQLRIFVNTFNGFRQEIRKLNNRLGGQTSGEPIEFPSTDQTTSSSLHDPAEVRRPFERRTVKSTYASYDQRLKSEVQRPTSDPLSTSGVSALPPSAWLSAEQSPQTHILAFHLPNSSRNDMIRRYAYRAHVREGDVISVSMSSGTLLTVEVIREMPSVSSRYETVWLAEVVESNRAQLARRALPRP